MIDIKHRCLGALKKNVLSSFKLLIQKQRRFDDIGTQTIRIRQIRLADLLDRIGRHSVYQLKNGVCIFKCGVNLLTEDLLVKDIVAVSAQTSAILLQGTKRLLQGLLKGSAHSHSLTNRLHAGGQHAAGALELDEGKARNLEQDRAGLGADGHDVFDEKNFDELVSKPTPERIFYVAEALRRNWSVERIHDMTGIDPWYLHRMAGIINAEKRIKELGLSGLTTDNMLAAKQLGFSDEQLAHLTGTKTDVVRAVREVLGVRPQVKTVDTCAGEFGATTQYHYVTYEKGNATEYVKAEKPRVMILSAGPNRIGQGIEFDYCCVHAAYALREQGYETVMVNCNPETVSTDYDTSDRLYFQPLTFEDVMDVIEVEKPEGVIDREVAARLRENVYYLQMTLSE